MLTSCLAGLPDNELLFFKLICIEFQAKQMTVKQDIILKPNVNSMQLCKLNEIENSKYLNVCMQNVVLMAITFFIQQTGKNPKVDLGAQPSSKEQDQLNENEGM
jgi:hypothetical protein